MGKLIVGLGNIGEQYNNTRHNVGFKIIDALAKKIDVVLDKQMFNGQFGVCLINNEKVVLAKPLTYMNLSGNFVKPFVDYFKVDLNDVIIIHDDISINLGDFKLRTNGSCGGQNGMRNIIDQLQSENIKRIKVGIGPRDKNMNLADFVLAKFNKEQLDKLAKVINQICNMLMHINEVDFTNLIRFAK